MKRNTARKLGLLSLTVALIVASYQNPNLRAQSQPPDASARLDLIGQSRLDGEQYGDIWVHGEFAYLGTYSCGGGVKIVDVSNPSSPQLAGSLITSLRSSYEDVVVKRVSTAAFRGDLLAAGLQDCKRNGKHGVQFWDVTNARQPVELGFFDTGDGTEGVHELYLFQRGDRVFALLAVPGSERDGAGGDFRIVEATDPRNPRQLADWGVIGKLGLAPNGARFCHSAWANDEGTVAYLSYWDAGVCMLDITDPTNPRFIGRTTYAAGEEGNAHSAWPIPSRNLLLVTDEDFSISGVSVRITEPPSLAKELFSSELGSTRQLCGSSEVTGEVVYVGRGCKRKHYGPEVQGKIALIDTAGCSVTKKVQRASEAGAVGVMVIVQTGFANPAGLSQTGIPGVVVFSQDGEALKSAVSGGEKVRVRIAADPLRASWGFLRIYDVSDPARPNQISTFATEHSLQCPRPTPAGWYTVHNPFVVGDTLYLSWYADGVRVLDISDPARPREIASFVPPNSDVWGVYPQGDLVFLSDIDGGLYILRRTIP